MVEAQAVAAAQAEANAEEVDNLLLEDLGDDNNQLDNNDEDDVSVFNP